MGLECHVGVVGASPNERDCRVFTELVVGSDISDGSGCWLSTLRGAWYKQDSVGGCCSNRDES